MNILDQLRDAIETDSRTRKAIGQAAEIDPAALHRFYWGEKGLSCESLARLADVLGLELRPVKPGRKPKAKRKAPKRKGGK